MAGIATRIWTTCRDMPGDCFGFNLEDIELAICLNCQGPLWPSSDLLSAQDASHPCVFDVHCQRFCFVLGFLCFLEWHNSPITLTKRDIFPGVHTALVFQTGMVSKNAVVSECTGSRRRPTKLVYSTHVRRADQPRRSGTS